MKTQKLGLTLREFIQENNLCPETSFYSLKWFEPDTSVLSEIKGDFFIFKDKKTDTICAIEDTNIYTKLLSEDEYLELTT